MRHDWVLARTITSARRVRLFSYLDSLDSNRTLRSVDMCVNG